MRSGKKTTRKNQGERNKMNIYALLFLLVLSIIIIVILTSVGGVVGFGGGLFVSWLLFKGGYG